MYKDHEKELATRREYMRKKRAAWKAQGLCSICGKPAREGQTKCEKHARQNVEYSIEYGKQLRAWRAEHGMCIVCGKESRPGRRKCAVCAARDVEYQRRKRNGNVER